jgi:two-component system alkaline phosphatase synthesis response regulator PhoP
MSSGNSVDPIFKSALLVEDDRNLSIAIAAALKKLDIPVTTASTLARARTELERELPELLLLDRRLPDGEGLTLCAELRRGGYQGMILVLSAAGEMPDRVEGLETGADDYLPKPFAWQEFHARIAALARRHLPEPIQDVDTSTTKTRLWRIDERRLRIHGPKGWVELTPLEFKLAQHLIQADGSIVSREQLLKEVWGFSLLPKTRTVDLFLSRLRKLFESDPENPTHFLTVRGAGYRFER